MPKFSVVISVYNKEQYIAATLQSVLDQTFQDFEIVILNDGSTDDSEKEILRFKDSRIRYFSEKNQGAAAGRNFVIKKATGEFIALLDADDWWDKHYLTKQSELIIAHPNESVFATALTVFENSKYRSSDYSIEVEDKDIAILDYFEASMLESILHSSSFMVKKDVFDVVGYYNPKIKSGQDTDLYVRLGLKYKVVFLNIELVTYNNMAVNSLFKTTRSVKDKADFSVYEIYEKDNLNVKRFLDLNRFSLSILAKLDNDMSNFNKISNKIDVDNLNWKQRFLLQQPVWMLKGAKQIKVRLERLGLRVSSFS